LLKVMSRGGAGAIFGCVNFIQPNCQAVLHYYAHVTDLDFL